MSPARAGFAHIFDRHSVGNCGMIFFRKYFHFPISVQQCCVAQSGPTTHRTDVKWLNNQFAGTETNGKINRQHHSQWPMWMAGKTNSNFNFMQIILTKSNKMKLLKQIGHLRLLDMCACVCSATKTLHSSSLYFTYELNCIRFVVCCWTDQNHVWNDGFPFVTSPFQCPGPGCFFSPFSFTQFPFKIIASNFHKFVIRCFCGATCKTIATGLENHYR